MNPSNFRIGAGALSIDGTDIGLTTQEGIVVTYEPNVHQHMSGRFGMTPVKASYIGANVTLEVYMGEHTLENMAEAFAGAVLEDDKIKFGGIAGRAIEGKELILTPFDGTPAWVFRSAVPTSSVETAYQVENERIIQVTFTALVDVTAPEDENIAYAS